MPAALAAKPSVILTRRIKAPPAKVFTAWTDPHKIMRWWGPDAGPTIHAETDVRVGGAFRVAFRTIDGKQHECSGVYREVVPDRKLVFSWTWTDQPEPESLVTIDIREDGDGALLTLTHERIIGDTVHDYARGWTGSLNKLEKLFA